VYGEDGEGSMSGHDAYARLWELAQDNHSAYDLTDIQPWMVQVAFPALVGEGHCHRCHGFEDGPCYDEHDGHHGCPPCQRRALADG
jgi:hypothetical protein